MMKKCMILRAENPIELESEISAALEGGYFLSHFVAYRDEYIAVLVKK